MPGPERIPFLGEMLNLARKVIQLNRSISLF